MLACLELGVGHNSRQDFPHLLFAEALSGECQEHFLRDLGSNSRRRGAVGRSVCVTEHEPCRGGALDRELTEMTRFVIPDGGEHVAPRIRVHRITRSIADFSARNQPFHLTHVLLLRRSELFLLGARCSDASKFASA